MWVPRGTVHAVAIAIRCDLSGITFATIVRICVIPPNLTAMHAAMQLLKYAMHPNAPEL